VAPSGASSTLVALLVTVCVAIFGVRKSICKHFEDVTGVSIYRAEVGAYKDNLFKNDLYA